MSERSYSLLRAILAMIGTIIGAGIFGIPAMMAKAGMLVGSILFWAIALLVLATHLLYVEIIAQDRHKRRLPGYVGEILGTWGRRVSMVTYSCQLIGANFAYILLGGEFLGAIASHFQLFVAEWVFQGLFVLGGAITVALGLKTAAKIESLLTWGLVGIMMGMIGLAIGRIDPVAISAASAARSVSWSSMLAPLGIFLFALSGTTVIPEIHEIVDRKISLTRYTVTIGSLVASFLTWAFGIACYAAMAGRDVVHPSALTEIFPSAVWWLVPVLGFLAVATSFITTALDLRATYQVDVRLPSAASWMMTLGIPVVLLVVTTRDFLSTIGTVGSLFTAMTSAIMVFAAFWMMNQSRARIPAWWRILTPVAAVLLFVGVIVQRFAAFFS